MIDNWQNLDRALRTAATQTDAETDESTTYGQKYRIRSILEAPAGHSAEFLYEARFFPDLEYTFKHALTHEVAYGGVPQDRQRALHARIAEAIEALYPGRLDEHVERLGHHAFRGEVWEKAVPYLRQAGAKGF